jgi:hypothetical protein
LKKHKTGYDQTGGDLKYFLFRNMFKPEKKTDEAKPGRDMKSLENRVRPQSPTVGVGQGSRQRVRYHKPSQQ